jgi:hypothetical protein
MPLARGAIAMPLGLWTMGMTLGMGAGLSVTKGTTSTILTAVLAFVTGGFASFVAVERKAIVEKVAARGKKAKAAGGEDESEEASMPAIDARRAGIGMTALSVGLMAGIVLGMWVRYSDPLGLNPPREADARLKTENDEEADDDSGDDDHGPGKVGLQNDLSQSACQRIKDQIDSEGYQGAGGAEEARGDLQEVMRHVTCAEL